MDANELIKQNENIDIETATVQKKLQDEEIPITVKSLGFYYHPYIMGQRSKEKRQTYGRKNETEDLNFTQYEKKLYPVNIRNLTLSNYIISQDSAVPFLNQPETKFFESHSSEDIENWVKNETRGYITLYQNKEDFFSVFKKLSSQIDQLYDQYVISSLLSIAITFKDNQTGMTHTGFAPVSDRAFSINQMLEDTSFEENEPSTLLQYNNISEEEKENLPESSKIHLEDTEVELDDLDSDISYFSNEEFEATMKGDALIGENWSLSLERITVAKWLSKTLTKYSTNSVTNKTLERVEKLANSEWIEVEGQVTTDFCDSEYLRILDIPFDHLDIQYQHSLSKKEVQGYLKNMDEDGNIKVEIRSFLNGEIEDPDDLVTFTKNKHWIIRPYQE